MGRRSSTAASAVTLPSGDGGSAAAVGDGGATMLGSGSVGAGAVTGDVSGAVLKSLPRPRGREAVKGIESREGIRNFNSLGGLDNHQVVGDAGSEVVVLHLRATQHHKSTSNCHREAVTERLLEKPLALAALQLEPERGYQIDSLAP